MTQPIDAPGEVRYEVEAGLAVITLAREGARNAFTAGMIKDLARGAGRAAHDKGVRAIVLTGAGGHFCAGADVKLFAALAALEDGAERASGFVREITLDFHEAVTQLARARKPWISVVDGTAAGGGFALAIGADATIASERARFTYAYTNIGLAPDGGSSYALPRLCGERRAQWLALRNPTLSASEALSMGLVSEVLPSDGFEERWRAIAREVAAGPTHAFAASKRLIRASLRRPLEAQLAEEREAIFEAARTRDFAEGTRAFAEKRRARFEGR
jgi:2-(1,2-epoxy-1,2-dihydrophenyl)acetyl-CoA isomerase